jgi:hypothetical protein
MTTIQQIESELKYCPPGTVIFIKGYTDSSGEVKDLEVELLDGKAYRVMIESDLRILDSVDEGDLADGFEGHSHVDLLTALSQLKESKHKSLAKFDGDEEQDYRGAEYESRGGNLGYLPSKPDCLYILKVRRVGGSTGESKPAKGAIPRAKQALASCLNLPTRNYIHTLCLADGKFEEVFVKVPVV